MRSPVLPASIGRCDICVRHKLCMIKMPNVSLDLPTQKGVETPTSGTPARQEAFCRLRNDTSECGPKLDYLIIKY